DTRSAARALDLSPPVPWRQGVARLAEWLQQTRGAARASRAAGQERVPEGAVR
ncbi:MAG: hypothetical protein JWN69_130, partial [Alphaproteobacteria bacterium]|nr:hypothetical protein [Alphaproteobacteria bacterium]